MKSYCYLCDYEAKRIDFGWYCDYRGCPNFGKQIAHLLKPGDKA